MTESETTKHVIRVFPEDGALINYLAGGGETQADVVRGLLDGDYSEDELAAARTLAKREVRKTGA